MSLVAMFLVLLDKQFVLGLYYMLHPINEKKKSCSQGKSAVKNLRLEV